MLSIVVPLLEHGANYCTTGFVVTLRLVDVE